MSSPAGGGSGNGVTTPFKRIAGGNPETRNRSAAPRDTRMRSQRSSVSDVSMPAAL